MKDSVNIKFTSSSEAVRTSKVGAVKELELKFYFPYIRLLIWALGLDKRHFMKFAIRVRSIWLHNGKVFLVRYLKECLRIVQHFVSGNPVSVTTEMPISISRGLPRIIPGTLRLQMHAGNTGVIRGVLSVFSIFRVIRIPVTLKLQTIVGPFTGLSTTLPLYELRFVKDTLPPMRKLGEIKLLFSRAAGPNCKVSGLGV